MLQTFDPSQPYDFSQPAFDEGRGQGFDLARGADILKRRLFYFLIPFSLAVIFGSSYVALQKPIYLSEGKFLVESQMIAPDLVRPIATASANDRVQVIQQRIMTRSNLLSIANKFGLFPDLRDSQTQLLDLMLERTQLKPVDLQGPTRQDLSAMAFTVGFEYESPEVAMRVASELLTLILQEDARARGTRATETIKILESEVRDLEDKLDSTQAQIAEIKQRPREVAPEVLGQENSQLTALAALKAELIQKTSIYSDAHPAVVALRKRIAAMEKAIAQSPQASATVQATQAADDIEAVRRQRQALEKRLDDANGKLATARLGESLERDQQSERLQVIENPALPQKPIKSGRLKMIGIVFALAAIAGGGTAGVAEALDRSIHGSGDLLGVVESHLIISIPYISTRAEALRAKRRLILVTVIFVLVLLAGLIAALVYWSPVDWPWFDRSALLDVVTQRSR